MAVTQVGICNQALVFLGEKTIISMDDNTRQGELCSTFFDDTRDSLLRSHPWNFALKRKALTKDTNSPLYGYDNQFVIPADCLRILSTNPTGAIYEVEGNRILTDESTLSIRYIYRNTDYASWTSSFAKLLAARLALELAHTITDKSSLQNAAMQWYEAVETEVKGVESQEGSPTFTNSNDLIDARWVGSSATYIKDNLP